MEGAYQTEMLLPLLLAAAAGYLLGALPFGYLVARSRGVDIFEVGSKSPGATNVRRVLGERARQHGLRARRPEGVPGGGLAPPGDLAGRPLPPGSRARSATWAWRGRSSGTPSPASRASGAGRASPRLRADCWSSCPWSASSRPGSGWRCSSPPVTSPWPRSWPRPACQS